MKQAYPENYVVPFQNVKITDFRLCTLGLPTMRSHAVTGSMWRRAPLQLQNINADGKIEMQL